MNKKSNRKPRGILNMSERELEYFRKNFNEAAELHGKIGKLYQVDTETQVNTDEYYNHKTPVDVAYTLNENPSKAQLLKLGWYTEDESAKPLLCTLTFLDYDGNPIYPSEGAILEVSARSDPHNLKEFQTQKFDIVKVSTDYDLCLFTCNLAPHRETLRPAEPVPTETDMYNENRYFNRKMIGVDDLK